MTREDILTELVELGVGLEHGSVYGPKTLRIVSFDFYEDGVRYGLSLSWFDSERVTARTIAEGIKELRDRAHEITAADLWIPGAGEMFLWDSGMRAQWVVAPWTLPKSERTI